MPAPRRVAAKRLPSPSLRPRLPRPKLRARTRASILLSALNLSSRRWFANSGCEDIVAYFEFLADRRRARLPSPRRLRLPSLRPLSPRSGFRQPSAEFKAQTDDCASPLIGRSRARRAKRLRLPTVARTRKKRLLPARTLPLSRNSFWTPRRKSRRRLPSCKSCMTASRRKFWAVRFREARPWRSRLTDHDRHPTS